MMQDLKQHENLWEQKIQEAKRRAWVHTMISMAMVCASSLIMGLVLGYFIGRIP